MWLHWHSGMQTRWKSRCVSDGWCAIRIWIELNIFLENEIYVDIGVVDMDSPWSVLISGNLLPLLWMSGIMPQCFGTTSLSCHTVQHYNPITSKAQSCNSILNSGCFSKPVNTWAFALCIFHIVEIKLCKHFFNLIPLHSSILKIHYLSLIIMLQSWVLQLNICSFLYTAGWLNHRPIGIDSQCVVLPLINARTLLIFIQKTTPSLLYDAVLYMQYTQYHKSCWLCCLRLP